MPSLRARLLDVVLRTLVRRRLASAALTTVAIEGSRRRMERYGKRVPPPRGFERVTAQLGGVPVEWTRARGDAGPVVLYLHGGAFLVGSPVPYRLMASQLASATRCDVAVIDYRLAPEHVFPAARDDAIAAYRALLESGIDHGRIVIAGDSAGGNLAAVTLLNVRKLGLPAPAAAVLLSPWTDLTGSGDSARTNAARDAMLPAARLPDAARLYAGGRNLDDPDLSPLFGDWVDCPPLSVHVGSGEILLDDSVRLVKRASAAGVDATLRVWPDMPHVFPVFSPLLPEARAAIREIAAFLATHVEAKQRSSR